MKWGNGWRSIFNKGSTVNQWKSIADMAEKAMSKVGQGKEITINNPSSKRTFTKGYTEPKMYSEGGSVTVGDNTSEFFEDEKPITAEVVSSAVRSVRYNPENERAFITFQGGNKEYEFAVTPDELDAFLNSDSKGRYVNSVWKKNNRAPGY